MYVCDAYTLKLSDSIPAILPKMMICIGPFCIPIWFIAPALIAFFWKVVEWFKSFGSSKSKRTKQPAVKGEIDTPLSSVTRTLFTCADADDLNKYVYRRRYAGLPTFIMFTSPSCGPCRVIKPIISKNAEDPRYANVQFVLVDVTTAHGQTLAMEEGVAALPKFVFINKGVVADTATGAARPPLEALLAKVAAAVTEEAELADISTPTKSTPAPAAVGLPGTTASNENDSDSGSAVDVGGDADNSPASKSPSQ